MTSGFSSLFVLVVTAQEMAGNYFGIFLAMTTKSTIPPRNRAWTSVCIKTFSNETNIAQHCWPNNFRTTLDGNF